MPAGVAGFQQTYHWEGRIRFTLVVRNLGSLVPTPRRRGRDAVRVSSGAGVWDRR